MISVITPVYNAARFLNKTIQSVLIQPEVSECILIDDGSTDNSWKIIQNWKKKDIRVIALRHNDSKNHGRSKTRNLGIKNATQPFVAFLDADDYYLPNRFTNDIKMLKSDSSVDGVYNAIGVKFYRDFTKKEYDERKITTINKKVLPSELFEVLLKGENGHFSLDGYILKRTIFNLVGNFNCDLEVGEDKLFILQTALIGKILSGILDVPVAIRGVHENNVFNKKEIYDIYRLKMYESLLFWCFNKNINQRSIDSILDIIWRLKYGERLTLRENIIYWKYLFSKNPKVLFSKLGLKFFPIVRLRQKYFSLFYN